MDQWSMIMRHKRLFLGFFLLFILIILMIYGNQEYDNKALITQKYQHIFQNFEEYNHSQISFSVSVKKIDEHNQTIIVFLEESPYSYPLIDINVKNLDYNVSNLKKEDIVDIIGILDGTNHVTANHIWKQDQWKNDLVYIRSLPAIPFVLYLLFKTWKFNPKKIRFYRRDVDT